MEENRKEIIEKYVNILSGSLPCKYAEYKTKNVTLEDIEYLVNHLDSLTAAFANNLSSSVICKLAELIVGFGLVHQVSSDDRDYSSEDFPSTAANAVKCFKYLKHLLKKLQSMENGFKRYFIINVLLLCATHNKAYHWSSSDSISSSEEFLADLLQCTQHKNLTSLLCDDSFHPTIFNRILKKMRPSLMKDSWMLYPSSCHIFHWLLCQVKHPQLVDYLAGVFPPPLMFVSYHAVPQKVLGIKCFNHILDNIPPTFMKLDGREDAIFHSLSPLTFSKELPVVEVLYPCLLKLPMMKTQKKTVAYWGESDKIFNHLLHMVDFENDHEMRRMYLLHIKDFVECTPPFKHLKGFKKVLEIVLGNPLFDARCKIIILQILKSVILSCWPRMEYHCSGIVLSVLLLRQPNDSRQDNAEISQLSKECLTLLKSSCEEEFMDFTSRYIAEQLPGIEMLKKIRKDD